MELFKLFGTIAINNDGANRAIDDTTGKAKNAESKMSSTFKRIGGAIAAAFAVDKIVSFGKEIVNAAAEVSAETSAFEQILGDYSEKAAEKVNKIADATGMVNTRLTPYMTSMTAKFKGLGYDIDDATTLASDGLNLAADASAFWDKSLEDAMGGLNSFINGSYEGGEAIGLFANDTQMAQYAVENGVAATTKAWANLDEKTKQATRLEYAQKMYKMSGATGQAAKESKQYANVQANLNEKWRQFKALIGEPLLQNVVLPAMQKLSDAVEVASEKFKNLKVWLSDNKDTVNKWKDALVYATKTVFGLWAAMGAGSIIMSVTKWIKGTNDALTAYKIATTKSSTVTLLLAKTMSIGQLIWGLLTGKVTLSTVATLAMAKAQAVLNGVMSANPIGLIIAAIVALVAIFVILWKKCDGFRNFFIGMWENIKAAFQSFIDFISPGIEQVKQFLQSLWDKIQEVWGQILESLEPLFTEIKGAFTEAWETIKLVWEYVSPFFEGIWNAIKGVFSSVTSVLGGFFSAAWGVIQVVWEAAGPYFTTIWNNIKAVFSVVKTVLSGFFKTAWVAIKAVWNVAVSFFSLVWAGIRAVFAVVKGVLSGDFSGAWEAIKNVWNKAKAFFKSVWDGIKNIFKSVKSWFGDTFKAAWEAVKKVFSNWGSFFGNLWNIIKDKFSKIGTNISNAISGAVKSGINGVISGIEGTINSAINIINGAINLINKLPGVSVGKVGRVHFPRLARGGVVDEATMAQIGENGAEAVVPLEKNTGWMDEIAYRLNALQANASNANPGDTSAILAKLDEMIESIKSMKIYLNGNILVGELVPAIDSRLGGINDLRKRGR